MSEKKEKAPKAAAAAAAAPAANEGVAPKLLAELNRVHMRTPKYEGIKVAK
jgi:hypothetical protein